MNAGAANSDGAATGEGGHRAAQVVDLADAALRPLTDPDRAATMAAYLKHVVPFLAVPAPERRRALREAWKTLRPPASTELGVAARALMDRRERGEAHRGLSTPSRTARDRRPDHGAPWRPCSTLTPRAAASSGSQPRWSRDAHGG